MHGERTASPVVSYWLQKHRNLMVIEHVGQSDRTVGSRLHGPPLQSCAAIEQLNTTNNELAVLLDHHYAKIGTEKAPAVVRESRC